MATSSEIIEFAGSLQGSKYAWGEQGKSYQGKLYFDCSGYVWYVFNHFFENDTDWQSRTSCAGYWGKSSFLNISKSELQPGDLVFYGTTTASHIAIYIGNSQVIHSYGGNKENTINNPGTGVGITSIDYMPNYLGAKRVPGVIQDGSGNITTLQSPVAVYNGTYSLGSNNGDRIFNSLIAAGASIAGACGVMGNLYAETTTFNPEAGKPDGNRKGIAQWDNSRWEMLKKRAGNSDPWSLDVQINFLLWELNGGDNIWKTSGGGFDTLSKDGDESYAGEVAEKVAKHYERCLNADGSIQAGNKRIDKAKEYYKGFTLNGSLCQDGAGAGNAGYVNPNSRDILTSEEIMREWGVSKPSISDEATLVESAKFSRKDIEITDDMYIGSDVIRNVKNKFVEVGAGYLIYFDNILMNKYVVSFTSALSTSGNIETANIELLYTPTFWKTEIRDSKTNLYQSIDAIENQTNVRIFVMNVVTRKFDIVFDGDIKQKQRRKSARGRSVVYTAKCHMDWLNRVTVPVSVPLNKTISIGDQIRWLAQGIDLSKISSIIFAQEASFKGKTLSQFIQEQVNKTFINNRLFSDPNTVAAWDDAVNRLCIMGDIDPNLRAAECVDFIVSASTAIIDTMYTVVHQTATQLLIEYFSDRDGMIRIKPPFWNQPVLKDHIIDPMFIIDQNDMTNWDGFYTRVIATGGNEEWDTRSGRGQYVESDFLTPVGAYIGDMKNSENAFWADFTGVHVKFREPDETAGLWVEDYSRIDESTLLTQRDLSIDWLKEFAILHDFASVDNVWHRNPVKHTGIDFYVASNFQGKGLKILPIFHLKGTGKIVGIIKEEDDSIRTTKKEKDLFTIVVNNDDGATIRYYHIHELYLTGNAKTEHLVNSNTQLASNGDAGHGEENSWCLSVEINGKFVDPLAYLDGKVNVVADATETNATSTTNTTSVSDTTPTSDTTPETNYPSTENVTLLENDFSYLNRFLVPSNDERKYGPNILEVNQSMIKFATSGAVDDAANPAMALRKYSQFMYYMMNSSLDTCNINIIAMPWLRPGFNVWLNPIDDDKIYYINEISYQGSPEGGVTSSLGLSLGRERRVFTTEPDAFGAQKDDCDNLLISDFIENQKVEKFGVVLSDNSEYENLREASFEFYNTEDDNVMGAESEEYFKSLYGNVNVSPAAFSVSTAKLETEEESEDNTANGKCSIALINDIDLNNLNNSVIRKSTRGGMTYECSNSSQRFLRWPVSGRATEPESWSTIITNGYEDGKHNGIDIYCGNGTKELEVTAMCSGIVVGIKKNSNGYIVETIENNLLKSNEITKVTYAHVDRIDKTLEGRYNSIINDPQKKSLISEAQRVADEGNYGTYKKLLGCVEKGAIIGWASKDLHISFSQKSSDNDSYTYKNIISYLDVTDVYRNNIAENNDLIIFNSEFFKDIIIEDDKQVKENIVNTSDLPISSFCTSKKFFSKEMSFEEIDKQIKELYSAEDVPAVIKNRAVALAARIDEADRFVQRHYDTEDFGLWQDVKKFSSYVAENQGYLTGEWVAGVYDGISADDPSINVQLADFEKSTKSTSGIYGKTNIAEVGEEIHINLNITNGLYTWEPMNRDETYNKGWGIGQGQKKIFEFWDKEGRPSEGHIATHTNDAIRYYVATTAKFGVVGQYMDFEIIPEGSNTSEWIRCIKMDEKSSGDSNYSENGHMYGDQVSVIEFCVNVPDGDIDKLPAKNPGQKGWKEEWHLGTIVKCVLYDKNILDEI